MSTLRRLFRNPGFTALAVFTLAFGIGANTVVFVVARTLLHRPLGYTGEDRLVWIRHMNRPIGVTDEAISWREMMDIRELTGSFQTLATYGAFAPIWQDGDKVKSFPTLQVTPGM